MDAPAMREFRIEVELESVSLGRRVRRAWKYFVPADAEDADAAEKGAALQVMPQVKEILAELARDGDYRFLRLLAYELVDDPLGKMLSARIVLSGHLNAVVYNDERLRPLFAGQ